MTRLRQWLLLRLAAYNSRTEEIEAALREQVLERDRLRQQWQLWKGIVQ